MRRIMWKLGFALDGSKTEKTAMQPRCTRARNGVDGWEIGQSCNTEFDSSTDMTDLQILCLMI